MCEGGRILALLDARKSRVYAQWFSRENDALEELTEPVDLALSEVLAAQHLNEPFVAVGEGTGVDPEAIAQAGGQVVQGAMESPAWAVGLLGQARVDSALPPQEVALRYLRPADAKKRSKPL